jgi:hypothetical protein
MVELRTFNPSVLGSSPRRPTSTSVTAGGQAAGRPLADGLYDRFALRRVQVRAGLIDIPPET